MAAAAAATTAKLRAQRLPCGLTLRGVQAPILVGVERRHDLPLLLSRSGGADLDPDLGTDARDHRDQDGENSYGEVHRRSLLLSLLHGGGLIVMATRSMLRGTVHDARGQRDLPQSGGEI